MTRTVRLAPPTDFRYFKHFDYGLLREVRDRLHFDMYDPRDRTWQGIFLNPFTASMSPIPEAAAKVIAGDQVKAPIVAQERPGGIVEPVTWPAQ